MLKNKIVPIFLVAALAIASVAGLVTYRAASASSTAAAVTGYVYDKGPIGGAADQYLADALGITLDQLKAAYTSANEAAIAQALAAGQITQAQADLLKQSGHLFELERYGVKDLDYNALLAKALKISTDQLQAAYQKAYTARIDQAVTDGKMTAEQADLSKGHNALSNSSAFQSAMQSAFEAAVKKAVESGLISQAQADLILKNTPANSWGMGKGGMRGGFDMGPGMGDGGRGGFEMGPGMGGGGRGHGKGEGIAPATNSGTGGNS